MAGSDGPKTQDAPETPEEARARRIRAAAERALAEAEARASVGQPAEDTAREIGGRDGPEPTRYGDWEKKGIAIDF